MGIADELITRGWEQGGGWALVPEEHTGPVCLEGAMTFAGLSRKDPVVAALILERDPTCLRDELGRPILFAWNDKPGRTFDEVLRVAKEADELLDAQ